VSCESLEGWFVEIAHRKPADSIEHHEMDASRCEALRWWTCVDRSMPFPPIGCGLAIASGQ
jgi:hypothetical protein